MNVVDRAAAILGERAQRDAPLGPLTTYRVGGRAALWWVLSAVSAVAPLPVSTLSHSRLRAPSNCGISESSAS